MASYQELFDLNQDAELRNRVTVAALVAAIDILGDAQAPAVQARWAAHVAANADAPAVAIATATDAQVQQQVNAIVPALVTAYGAE